MERIDTSGMSCPQPVLMVKKELDKNPEGLDILVDNNTAKQNVKRFLESSGYKITIIEEDNGFMIKARK